MSADPIVYCLENLTDYRQFERLCSDVMNQSGFTDIEPLGGSNDRGRDAIHISRKDSEDITIFAYSVRGDWQNKLLEDCRRIQEEKHELYRLVFVCTASVTSTQRDTVKQKILDNFGWTLEIFDLERLRIRLAGYLRHLIAQHPSIFCPPFFPTRGGLSIAECRDTLVIDHDSHDHALATWLARRLQLAGHHVWCYGTSPLAGENADDSIRMLISQRAIRYLPILSASSVADIDFLGRCGTAAGIDGLVLPCFAEEIDRTQLPSKMRALSAARFSDGWSIGLKDVTASLKATGIEPALSSEKGKAIALRLYVPEPVIKSTPETVSHRFLSYTHVDGRATRVAVTGEQLYGSGERAVPFRYQLCSTFRVGLDEAGAWWVTMRIYVRITDVAGKPHVKKAITRRRKQVANDWWNKEWFARTIAVMHAIANGGSEITVGSGNKKVTVSTKPLAWECPVAIDYAAVERIGDFQEEMAQLRYVENDDEDAEEPDGVSNDE